MKKTKKSLLILATITLFMLMSVNVFAADYPRDWHYDIPRASSEIVRNPNPRYGAEEYHYKAGIWYELTDNAASHFAETYGTPAQLRWFYCIDETYQTGAGYTDYDKAAGFTLDNVNMQSIPPVHCNEDTYVSSTCITPDYLYIIPPNMERYDAIAIDNLPTYSNLAVENLNPEVADVYLAYAQTSINHANILFHWKKSGVTGTYLIKSNGNVIATKHYRFNDPDEPVAPTPVPPTDTDIGLSATSVTIDENGSAVVTLPKNTKATVKTGNSKVATAKYNKSSGKITITGKEAGSTTITVKVGKKTEKISVTVNGIPMNVSTESVTVNYNKKVIVNTLKKKNIKVSSSNKSIATAKYSKSNGKITIQGKKKGNATVYVKYGNDTKTINVNVDAWTTKVNASKKVSLKQGKTKAVKVTATPKRSITSDPVTVTSSNEEVATVSFDNVKDKVNITAQSAGTATVTVTVGNVSKDIVVTVKAK